MFFIIELCLFISKITLIIHLGFIDKLLNGLDLYHYTFTQLIELNPEESILLFPANTQVKFKNCLIKNK